MIWTTLSCQIQNLTSIFCYYPVQDPVFQFDLKPLITKSFSTASVILNILESDFLFLRVPLISGLLEAWYTIVVPFLVLLQNRLNWFCVGTGMVSLRKRSKTVCVQFPLVSIFSGAWYATTVAFPVFLQNGLNRFSDGTWMLLLQLRSNTDCVQFLAAEKALKKNYEINVCQVIS